MAASLPNNLTGRTATGGANGPNQSPYHDKRIQAGLSTQIVIKVQGYDANWYDVGAVQQFQVSERRNLNPIQEVGTDGIIQIHPMNASPIELTVNRCVFDYQRMAVAFQRGFQHVMSQRFPFDIVVMDYNPYLTGSSGSLNYDVPQDESGSSGALQPVITRFVNCWFSAIGYSYEAENYLIRENASLSCEAVYDTIPGNGILPLSGIDDVVERVHDRNLYNGVMVEAYAAIQNVNSLNT